MFSEYNSKVYLTQLLVCAHETQDTFQSQMKTYFNENFSDVAFQSAPVKTYNRCLMKAQTGMYIIIIMQWFVGAWLL